MRQEQQTVATVVTVRDGSMGPPVKITSAEGHGKGRRILGKSRNSAKFNAADSRINDRSFEHQWRTRVSASFELDIVLCVSICIHPYLRAEIARGTGDAMG